MMMHPYIKTNKVAAVVLAAGTSARLGSPKQLLEFEDRTLIENTVMAVSGAGILPILVVTGKVHHTVKAILGNTAWCSKNKNFAQGMGSSIAHGVEAAGSLFPGLEAVCILTCDQPYLTADYLAGFLATYTGDGAQIIASAYAGTSGPPCLFGKNYFAELMALSGDEGAKRILRAHEAQVELVAFPQGATDIDTQEDWKNFIAENAVRK